MTKKLNKKVLIALGVVVVVAAAAGTYYYFHRNSAAGPKSYDTTKPENKQSAVDPKQDTDNAKRQNAAATQGSSGSTGNVTPQITYFGQANGMVILDATVNGATSGTCTATFKNGGSTVAKISQVSLVTNYYACGEIQAPSSDFNPKGSWSATVKLNNGPVSPSVEANIN